MSAHEGDTINNDRSGDGSSNGSGNGESNVDASGSGFRAAGRKYFHRDGKATARIKRSKKRRTKATMKMQRKMWIMSYILGFSWI